ncbi:RNA 2',3'-cyclic phosphodiesterase [Thalassotalea fusca]
MNKRLFYALDILPSDKKRIEAIRQPIIEHFRPVMADNFHITLCFMGNISNPHAQALNNIVDNWFHTYSTLSRDDNIVIANCIGLFKKPQVLYLGFTLFPEVFRKLANNLSQAANDLKIHQENRPYFPHLTVARKAKYMPEYSPFSLTINIHSLSLYESVSTKNGVKYTPLKTWRIKSNT